MKKVILTLAIALTGSMAVYAQCDKKVLLSSSKTEHLNGSNEVQDTREEHTILEFNKTDITVIPNDSPDDKMTGTVSSYTCNWKVPFKEGKTVIKASLVDKSGDVKNVIITIEGKEGKISAMAELDDNSGRKMRLTPDKFEEKK